MSFLSELDLSDRKTRMSVLMAGLVIVILSWLTIIDTFAIDFIDDSLEQAAIAFASARVFNAVVSVLQTTTVDVFFANMSVGEVLDPLNDMAEDFSSVMKMVLVSLLLQKILVEIVSENAFNLMMSISFIYFVATVLLSTIKLQLTAFKLFLTFVALRYLVLVIVLLNGGISYLLIDDIIDEQNTQVLAMEKQIETIQNSPAVIPPEEAAKIKGELDSTNAQLEVLNDKNLRIQSELDILKADLSHLEKQRSELLDRMSLTERYNPLSQNDELDEIDLMISNIEVQVSNTENQQSENERLRAIAEKDIEVLEALQRGESPGIFNDITSAVSGMVDKVTAYTDRFKYENIKSLMTDSIDSMLPAIASFLLKTIFLPLLFLFLFSRIFKTIWNIDFRQIAGRVKKNKTESVSNV